MPDSGNDRIQVFMPDGTFVAVFGARGTLDRCAPIAQTLDAKANLAAQDRMKRLASSRRLIVPGHDPAVFTRFRKLGPDVAAIP